LHEVVIEGAAQGFKVAPGQTVLAAAVAAGVGLRSSCRNGTCRECRCRVLQGAVSHIIAWPGLSVDEQREGWFLPCVAVTQSDLRIERR
jgi:ferredoxin